jgi:hypothetical protein
MYSTKCSGKERRELMQDVSAEYLTIKTSVVVPGLQALVNGVFYGTASTGIIAVANSLDVLTVPPWAVGVTVGSLAGLAAWRNLLNDWRLVLYGVSHDYEPADPDTIILPPVRVELSSNNGRAMQFVDLPAEPDQLITLGAGIVEGLSFTEAQWTGKGAPFSRSQFVQLRGEMLRRGLLAWNSANDNARGVKVTGKGMALCRHFASMSQSPTPILEMCRQCE